MKRIAVFASGSGSNTENIIRYFNDCNRGAEVALVICNKPGAGVVWRARWLGVPVRVMTPDEIRNETLMSKVLDEYSIDIIILAGFLLMVPPFLTERYRGRILNIHPSLLPKYGGKGMYGRHIHEAVVAAGETETGITIHHVSDKCDDGEIIFQAKISISPDDTPETVELKIHELERDHFPRVIEKLFC